MKPAELDTINIDDLEVFANHGVFHAENELGQKFLLSLTLYLDTHNAGRTDALSDSVDYGEICHFVSEYTQKHTRKLLEAAAEDIAVQLLVNYERIEGVTLEIKKPWAPIGLPFSSVSVKITRSRHTAYIALGSNIGDTKGFLDGAVKALDSFGDCRVKKVSEYILTKPYGVTDQADFLNGCLELETLLTPHELLERLHEIEKNAGRERIIHWGPRTLDLDIILYDDLILDTQDLTVPHREMHLRDFVLKPLCEIAPFVRHPILNKTAEELLSLLEAPNTVKLSDRNSTP